MFAPSSPTSGTSPILKDLTRQPDLDPAVSWRALRDLLDRVQHVLDRDTFLDECLDRLVELFGADRGLILLAGPDGGTSVINARGHGQALPPHEREEISKTLIREVLLNGRCLVWEPDGALAGTESIALLGILTAIAAPLQGATWQQEALRDGEGAVPRGVLYLDVRDHRKHLGQSHRELFQAAATLISIVLEQTQRLRLAREHLREARLREVTREETPTLDDLLRFRSQEPLRRELESCLRGEMPILILGESGTGKTLLARAIAEASGRNPIVRAVLGFSDDLNTIASELFGHERGAFSGALTRRTGLVEFAHQGTLIFDEILNLPPNAQQLLLDFTQFGTYRPLGHDKPQPKQAQVRLIAATNGDLEAAIHSGRFRQDLYYRLSATTLHLLPLRQRREDIPSLAEDQLRRIDPVRGWSLSVPLRRLLLSPDLSWPGNVRQLEAVIRRARERALTRDPHTVSLHPEHIEPRDLGGTLLPAPSGDPGSAAPASPKPGQPSAPVSTSSVPLDPEALGQGWTQLQTQHQTLAAVERELIVAALRKHGGVVAYAARDLGVGRTSLLSRMQTLGIERPRHP